MNAPWSARVANSNRVMSEMAKAVAVLRALLIAFLAFREVCFDRKQQAYSTLMFGRWRKAARNFSFTTWPEPPAMAAFAAA